MRDFNRAYVRSGSRPVIRRCRLNVRFPRKRTYLGYRAAGSLSRVEASQGTSELDDDVVRARATTPRRHPFTAKGGLRNTVNEGERVPGAGTSAAPGRGTCGYFARDVSGPRTHVRGLRPALSALGSDRGASSFGPTVFKFGLLSLPLPNRVFSVVREFRAIPPQGFVSDVGTRLGHDTLALLLGHDVGSRAMHSCGHHVAPEIHAIAPGSRTAQLIGHRNRKPVVSV